MRVKSAIGSLMIKWNYVELLHISCPIYNQYMFISQLSQGLYNLRVLSRTSAKQMFGFLSTSGSNSPSYYFYSILKTNAQVTQTLITFCPLVFSYMIRFVLLILSLCFYIAKITMPVTFGGQILY